MYTTCRNFLSQHGRKLIMGSVATAPIAVLGSSVIAEDTPHAHPPHYHWEWEKWNKSYDVAAMRRGYQVYKEVCSSCHSFRYLKYRQMVGVIFTEKQAKREAQAAMIEDGPDERGEMFLRPGILTDAVPPPYKNDNAARASNSGALPPDLSLIVGARRGGPHYIFSLLTGYTEEVPPGVELARHQSFNPFFEGGAISMKAPLADGAVSYPDGTPATVAQMARDVTEFLSWASWRAMDRSKQVGMVMLLFTGTSAFFFYWGKRWAFAGVTAQRITYKMKPWA